MSGREGVRGGGLWGCGGRGERTTILTLEATGLLRPSERRDSAGPAWIIQLPKRAGQTLFTFNTLLPDTIPTPTYAGAPFDPGSPSVQHLAKL